MITSPYRLRLLVLAVIFGNSFGFLSFHRNNNKLHKTNTNKRRVAERAVEQHFHPPRQTPLRRAVASSLLLLSSYAPVTTRLYALSSSLDDFENDNNDDSTDSFMASLRNRVAQVQDRETKLPLVVLDAMLPRQVLKIQVKNKLLMELVRDCIEKENPFIGMVGMARLANGNQVHLKSGVEVRIVNPVILEGAGSVRLELHGGRRFIVRGEVVNAFEGGWTEARVEFLESSQQEQAEITQGTDRLAVARDKSQC
jgi:hypothetical protein